MRSPSFAMATAPFLVARRTDDPHHFCKVVAGIRDAVGSRAAVVDAVSVFELVQLVAELEPDRSTEDDEELLRVPVRVLLGSRRTPRVELADDDPKPLADVDVVRHIGSARRHAISPRPCRRKTEATLRQD